MNLTVSQIFSFYQTKFYEFGKNVLDEFQNKCTSLFSFYVAPKIQKLELNSLHQQLNISNLKKNFKQMDILLNKLNRKNKKHKLDKSFKQKVDIKKSHKQIAPNPKNRYKSLLKSKLQRKQKILDFKNSQKYKSLKQKLRKKSDN